MIKGINHITLAVSDLKASVFFYKRVLGLSLVSIHEGGAYFKAGDTWFCLVADSAAADQSRLDYSHIAFDLSQEDFAVFDKKLAANGARIWKKNASEGLSIYFLDPDGHKLEAHVGTLESRLHSMRSNNHNSTSESGCVL
ncbi:MAG: VOC family protein [Pseudomonadota bacterium]